MSKKILEDIIKVNNKKVIVNDRIYSRKKNNESSDFIQKRSGTKKKKISQNALWLIAIFSVIFLFFTISSLFTSATVTIFPKVKEFSINKKFTAIKESNANLLSYDLIILSGEESKEVSGGEEKEYQEYAKGKVIIYNAFNSIPQKLSKDTRLEGSNGKIYKTKTEVTVPGIKNNIPGKVEVDIYASEIGNEYNDKPIDFKIFGFKGTSKYNKFYARSVGNISGGLKGKSRQVDQIEKEKVLKELKESLSAKLFQKAKDQIPKDFILLNNAMYFNVDEENETQPNDQGNITFKIRGTFNGVIFNKQKLEKEIINLNLNKDENKDVYIPNLENLDFSGLEKGLLTLVDIKELDFNLSGNVKIVWRIDSDKIRNELLGSKKKEFNLLMEDYKDIIYNASLTIKPVWEKNLPDKDNAIKIVVNYPL